MVLISTLGLFFKSWDKHINIKILDIKESLLKKNFAEKKKFKLLVTKERNVFMIQT